MSSRRLSQAIADGDGISLLVTIERGEHVRDASARGADGIVTRDPERDLAEAELPVLAFGLSPDAAALAGAHAVVLEGADDGVTLGAMATRAHELGLEAVVQVADEDALERVLEELDPEIVLLSAAADLESPLDHLLQLLLDVPAGKLAIAELAGASRAEVEELERAGVDAVLVSGDVAELASADLPEV